MQKARYQVKVCVDLEKGTFLCQNEPFWGPQECRRGLLGTVSQEWSQPMITKRENPQKHPKCDFLKKRLFQVIL